MSQSIEFRGGLIIGVRGAGRIYQRGLQFELDGVPIGGGGADNSS